jgi:parallel beta-helix repeat protein
MCASPNAALAISAFALVGLLACHSDPASPPRNAGMAPVQLGLGGSTVLVVDNDGADCPNADFTTIQAAVDAAEPGSTILVCAGTYYEWVVIGKNELRLQAKGKLGDVVLDGQGLPALNQPCSPTSTVAMQCAGFELRNADGNVIEGFLVRRYWEAGIWLRMGSSGNTIRKNVTTESPHHDGIQVANSPGNLVEHNTAFANFAPPVNNACGINVTGSGSVGNTVRHNETFENDFGIQVNAATNNVIRNNHSHANRRVGIRNIASSNGTLIENNRVFDNGGAAQFGGILLSGSTGVTVARNKAFNNAPFDLFWDGVGVNEFENNHCGTSSPPGLCEQTEGASKE